MDISNGRWKLKNCLSTTYQKNTKVKGEQTMRNRKTVVVAFLLVAVMLLSVGYAALTDVLFMDGTAVMEGAQVVEDFNADVYFNTAKAANRSGAATVATPEDTATITSDNDIAEFKVYSLHSINQTAVFWFEIKNDYDYDVTVSIKEEIVDAKGYFKLEYEYFDAEDGTSKGKNAVTVTKEGGSLWVKVTVSLYKVLDNNEGEINAKIGLKLNAVYDDASTATN
jgi:hypothetical protein